MLTFTQLTTCMEEVDHDEVAGDLLCAGKYREALDYCLARASVSISFKALVRDAMLQALSGILDSIIPEEGEGEEEEGPRGSPAGLKWEGSLSEVATKTYSLYWDDSMAMTLIGAKCLEGDLHQQARFFLKTAITSNPSYLLAREKLGALHDCMVPRWHFHMLNDIQRNSAYSRALRLALTADTPQPRTTVLDIGSGTGLLSMLAVRAGAKRVYAVEVNGTMAAVSRDVLASNEMGDKVIVVHRLSTALSVPRDIPSRVDLVVTETVDAGLLGEHIIPTLRHAWQELLLPPTPVPGGSHMTPLNSHMTPVDSHMTPTGCGRVIPAGATVYATAIECQEIRRKSRLLSCSVAGVNMAGIRLEGSCKAATMPHPTDGRGRPTGALEQEVYSCERLSQIRGGVTHLTQPQAVLQFDFTQPQIPLPSSRVPLTVTRAGTLDAIAVWFDLHLCLGVSLSTHPDSDLCWEQAFFPLVAGRREGVEPGVEPGDVVRLHASCSDTSLHMEVEGVLARGRAAAQFGEEAVDSRPVFYVERSDLMRANDLHFANSYREAIVRAVRAVRAVREEEEEGTASSDSDGVGECLLLDMSYGLPLFGIAAAKLGADFVQVAQFSPAYLPLLECLAAHNQVSECTSFHQLGAWQCTPTPQLGWDVVVCDLVSPQGTLREGVLERLGQVLATQHSCHPPCVLVPRRLGLRACLVSAPCLRARSCVLGTVATLGLEVARHLNQYQAEHLLDLDLGSCPLQWLSEDAALMEVDLTSLHSALPHVSVEVPVRVTAGGSVSGIAYWFTLGLFEGVALSTGPHGYAESHWHQCVFMLPEDVPVSEGDVVTVKALLRDSCVSIDLIPSE